MIFTSYFGKLSKLPSNVVPISICGKAPDWTRIFNPDGQDDIGGGCGQLWYVQKWMKERSTSK